MERRPAPNGGRPVATKARHATAIGARPWRAGPRAQGPGLPHPLDDGRPISGECQPSLLTLNRVRARRPRFGVPSCSHFFFHLSHLSSVILYPVSLEFCIDFGHFPPIDHVFTE